MKFYKPYTILDNHAYGIYSSHNLSFYLYYTRSPSVAYGASSLVRGSLTAFPLTPTHCKISIYRLDSAIQPRRCAAPRFDETRR